MAGMFSVVSSENCVKDLIYGNDYQSHLGTQSTQRAGIAILNKGTIKHKIKDIYKGSQFKFLFIDDIFLDLMGLELFLIVILNLL